LTTSILSLAKTTFSITLVSAPSVMTFDECFLMSRSVLYVKVKFKGVHVFYFT